MIYLTDIWMGNYTFISWIVTDYFTEFKKLKLKINFFINELEISVKGTVLSIHRKMNSGISEERGEYIPHSLLAISNKETGEYWNQSSEDVETLCCCNLGGIPKRTICMKCTCSSTVKHWRIPKEYSKLGSPKDLECKNNILVSCTSYIHVHLIYILLKTGGMGTRS